MVSFASDYVAGAHPELLGTLLRTNMEPLPGYGTDEYCDRAKAFIRAAVGIPDADVEFIAGGTQTNQIVISTMLHDWEGVLAADTGHVTTHEAGAIEYSGHKVIPLTQTDGKIKASTVDDYIAGFYSDENHEHEVFPGMVYISYPTEWGTLYTKDELKDLHEVCRKYGMPLYIDGARLAYGLASSACDLTIHEFAELCDVFYIGGTKCGALCGEAIVFTRGNRPEHFMNAVKKRGALLAKGRLLGVQFDTLFSSFPTDTGSGAAQNAPDTGSGTDQNAPGNECGLFENTLYYEIGRHGIEMSEKLEKILRDKGIKIYMETPTNQKFVIMEDSRLEKLKGIVEYGFWEKADDEHTVVRFATSWSTTDEDLKTLAEVL
ncbi:MAG: low specificity L-threonine aldolase [Eubacterium sp.]|nr:low specificity L-threonine aldolase [Eubacterium sp.]